MSDPRDSVLHLWYDAESKEVAENDDAGHVGNGLNSLIDYTVPAGKGGKYTLVARGHSDKSGGSCTIAHYRFPSFISLSRVEAQCGGHREPASCLEANSWIHATLMRDGATDPFLYFLVRDHPWHKFRIVKWDDDGDVGRGSRLVVPNTIDCTVFLHPEAQVLVSTYHKNDREGNVRLYFNNIKGATASDKDGDGLDDLLEQELKLCWHPSVPCLHNPFVHSQDTDGDGLTDSWEVLGKDDGAFPQLLPKWGAEPRRKDVFLEIDQYVARGRPIDPPDRLTEAEANTFAKYFADTTPVNPDGSKGIRVHFDVGHPCGSGPDGITDTCGNFGGETIEKRTLDGNTATLTRSGSTITLQDPNAVFDKALVGKEVVIEGAGNGNDGKFIIATAGSTTLSWTNSQSTGGAASDFKWTFDWLAFYDSGLMQPRHGLFHWMLADAWNPGGQGYVNTPFFTTSTGPNLPHELGHNLGLNHGGNESRNCKPHYLSLMNYLYDGRFSAGKADANLDPLGLSETERVGTDADDISSLEKAPARYDLHNCQTIDMTISPRWVSDAGEKGRTP